MRLIVQERLFCYARLRSGGDFLTVEEYIKSKEKFELMQFATIYTAIMELINDGYIKQTAFEKAGDSGVETSEPEPEWEKCRRLYGSRYFFSNR